MAHPQRPRGSASLLVMDNCEQLVAARATGLEALRQRDPLLRLLLISQTPLGTDDEQAHRLGPLALPPAGVETAEAARCSAIELFVCCVKSAADGFALTPGNVREVVALCRALDGVLLAPAPLSAPPCPRPRGQQANRSVTPEPSSSGTPHRP